MPFKALNNKEEEKTEHSYIYSHTHTHTHTTKHLTLLTKGKRSQSAFAAVQATFGIIIVVDWPLFNVTGFVSV